MLFKSNYKVLFIIKLTYFMCSHKIRWISNIPNNSCRNKRNECNEGNPPEFLLYAVLLQVAEDEDTYEEAG